MCYNTGVNKHDMKRFRNTNYWVSSEGVVVSRYLVGGDNRFKKGEPSSNNERVVGGKSGNYLCVRTRQGDSWFIHQMVMECYGLPKPGEGYVIDHIDNNPHNNNITNLQWLTIGENVSKEDKHTYPQHLREEILSQYIPRVMSFNKLSKKYNIPTPTIKYWYYNH